MRNFLHIMVLFAFLGGIIAPACGFAWGGKFSVVEICTSEGFESRIVQNKGGDSPRHKMAEECQFCFSHANLTAFLPTLDTLTLGYDAVEKTRIEAFIEITLSRLITPLHARAPPRFV